MTCPDCAQAKKQFEEWGIDCDGGDIEEGDGAVEMYERYSSTAVPTIAIGGEAFPGFARNHARVAGVLKSLGLQGGEAPEAGAEEPTGGAGLKGSRRLHIPVEGMSCASCAQKVEKALREV